MSGYVGHAEARYGVKLKLTKDGKCGMLQFWQIGAGCPYVKRGPREEMVFVAMRERMAAAWLSGENGGLEST